jgi:hypothetical protein
MLLAIIDNAVLFHPDYDRRLRIHTGYADADICSVMVQSSDADDVRLSRAEEEGTITTGGDLHPALRTKAAEHPQQQYCTLRCFNSLVLAFLHL